MRFIYPNHVVQIMKMMTVRIEPNSAQRRVIDQMIDANRLVYNGLVTACKLKYSKDGKLPSAFELSGLATKMRHNSPYLAFAHSATLNETAKRVYRACKKTLSNHRCESGVLMVECCQIIVHGPHFPRYRSAGSFNSYTYSSPRDFSVISRKGDGKPRRVLRLGKVPGLLRYYNQGTIIKGRMKTCTIKKKDMGRYSLYYAFIAIDDEPRHFVEPTGGPVGVDIGVSNIAALSDGTVFPNDRIFRKLSKKLARLQRKLAKSLYGSREYMGIQTSINHVYKKIRDHRKNKVETISAYIVNNHDVIGMEKLSVNTLRSISVSRQMTNGYNDASLGNLVKRIMDKASGAGRIVIMVDPKNTSQMCSQCGSMVKKDLKVRVHSCSFCGYTADRDVNAARNILIRALVKINGMDQPSRPPAWGE